MSKSRVRQLIKNLRRVAEVRASSLGFGPEGFEEHDAANLLGQMYTLLSDLELSFEDCLGLMSEKDRADVGERAFKEAQRFFREDQA